VYALVCVWVCVFARVCAYVCNGVGPKDETPFLTVAIDQLAAAGLKPGPDL
jgi:hypothetical protein